MDHKSMDRQVKSARAKQVEIIKYQQAHGNPMGDYLYAVANAEGWWPDNPITDPVEIEKILEKAATNGSSDAMIMGGLMLISGHIPNQSSKIGSLKSEQRNVEKGLSMIEQGTSIRCFVVVPNADFYEQCFSQISPLWELGAAYQNGRGAINKNGKGVDLIEKNQTLSDYWYKQDKSCQFSAEHTPKILACQ
jgi:TPR repeat protein